MSSLTPKSSTNTTTLSEAENSFGTGGENGSMSNGGFNGSYVSKGWNSIKTGILSNIVGATTNANYNGNPINQQGGFGGGGISSNHAGGAGGGYSGGGVVNRGEDFKTVGGGGGGSRFDTHFSDKKRFLSTLGYNDGGGYIKIWGPY